MARLKGSAWREEVVDDATISAAEALAPLVAGRFYLAGGTALALRLGHRVSLDLDLFSPDERLEGAARAALFERLPDAAALEVLEEKDGTCHLRLFERAVSLFHHRYPLLEPTRPWRGLAVASLSDIAAMKLSAAIGRGARKDFIDLKALADAMGLSAMLQAGKRRFADHPDFVLQAAKALVYFEDADSEPPSRLLKPSDWEATKAYFRREVPRLMRSRLG
ncbi:MAG: nucleotidyl transferase AbiEii/AbiGii toxin family protein [Elusimicrobia bacterium]|nr:nucleotidyl transferase AbiEii/AbiGii toxin family protein [Elusimicrobiota bacterium]